MHRRLTLAACSVITAAASFLAASAPAQAGFLLPVDNNFSDGYIGNLANPQTPPPGANNWGCKSFLHPVPVILVHGTWEHQADNWHAVSPYLTDRGYCVYTFNFGGKDGDVLWAYKSFASSAQELSTFVNQVLAKTGAAKVDLVGHSQGGSMPRYYLKFLGGTAKVDKLIGLGASNHGTDVDGLATLAGELGVWKELAKTEPGLTDQVVGSDLMKKLATCPGGPDADICPGDPVQYTVIATKDDEVVTPYTSAFLKGAKNITVQDVCPNDETEHLTLSYDSNIQQMIANALDPAHPWPIFCHPVKALVGG
jgi:triacylglycerol esterase/lipase EstA (alpha/beta hydrolase family)